MATATTIALQAGMTLLGVSVGLVVVLMYMPIFEMAGNIKSG